VLAAEEGDGVFGADGLKAHGVSGAQLREAVHVAVDDLGDSRVSAEGSALAQEGDRPVAGGLDGSVLGGRGGDVEAFAGEFEATQAQADGVAIGADLPGGGSEDGEGLRVGLGAGEEAQASGFWSPVEQPARAGGSAGGSGAAAQREELAGTFGVSSQAAGNGEIPAAAEGAGTDFDGGSGGEGDDGVSRGAPAIRPRRRSTQTPVVRRAKKRLLVNRK